MWITCAWTHRFGKTVFNSVPANTGRTLWCPIWASGVVSTGTKCSAKWLWGCNLGFSDSTWKQHQPFVSAYLLRLQCQSAGSLKTQECIISPGYSCGPCEFYSVVILSSHLFLHFLLTRHLAYDNTCGDCSFKLDFFLDVFIKWCQTLPVNHWTEQAISAPSKQQYRHQAYSNFWLEFRKTLTCTAFLIVFEYIIFSTRRLTISE